MINSLEDVQSMRLAKGALEDDSIFKPSYMMSSPGSPSDRLSVLVKKISGMPRDYIEVISLYKLMGVEVGGFSLWPYSFKSEDLVEDVMKAIEDPFFPREFMERHKMYQVGSYNTDLICVTEGTDHFGEGEVLYVDEGYDIYHPEDSQIHRLARDFEQFLIIAGNLEEIHCTMPDDVASYDEKKAEFLGRLYALGVDEVYHAAWLRVL